MRPAWLSVPVWFWGATILPTRGLFFNQGGRAERANCLQIMHHIHNKRTASYQRLHRQLRADLPAESFVTHSFCSFLRFGTQGEAGRIVGSTLYWGHTPLPLNCSKLLCCICGWFGWLSRPDLATLSGNIIKRKQRPCLQFPMLIFTQISTETSSPS